MPFNVTEIEVCEDCILFLSNGQCEGCTSCAFSEDPSSEPCQTVWERMVAVWGEDVRHISPACGEDCEGPFSYAACEGCGSTLGGGRHAAAVLVPVEGS